MDYFTLKKIVLLTTTSCTVLAATASPTATITQAPSLIKRSLDPAIIGYTSTFGTCRLHMDYTQMS